MSSESLRKKMIAEWRGFPEVSGPLDNYKSVGDLLTKVLPKLGLKDRLNEQQIMEAWREIVGDFLAQHSLPIGLNGGILIVQVVQPSVRYELDRTWKRAILDKLQA